MSRYWHMVGAGAGAGGLRTFLAVEPGPVPSCRRRKRRSSSGGSLIGPMMGLLPGLAVSGLYGIAWSTVPEGFASATNYVPSFRLGGAGGLSSAFLLSEF